MTAKRSKLEPQSPYWYEDLPGRTALLEGNSGKAFPDAGQDVLQINEKYIELSRATSIQRGGGVLIGCGMLAGMLLMADVLVSIIITVFPKIPALSILLACGLIAFLVLIIYVIKREIRTPRDLPVRFHRDSGKIISLEYVTKLNPFAHWKVVQRELNWSHAAAEISKISGYNGKTYSVRYSLIIAECDPDSGKVKQRIVLKADEAFPLHLHRMWAFIRSYMINGPSDLKVVLRPAGVSLKRCLLYYYPVLDFTAEGHERRRKLNIVEWVFGIVVLIPLFWLFLPLSICEYVALKLAPEPQWSNSALDREQ